MKKYGFTLIELLIVIGILAILVVTVLVTLNPAEAQKKTRDTKRMKDMGTLVAIVDQYINDGNAPVCTVATGCVSTDQSGGTECDNAPANWLDIDVSNYCTQLPIDPRNGQSTTVYGETAAVTTTYRVKMSGSDYEVNVRQESKGNSKNVDSDGGDSTKWAEAGSSTTLLGD
jgi:prepilin-type N-terminal cleavage/methylation domain-containing protein